DGLEQLVREGLAGGRLDFVHGAAAAVPGRELVLLCVPTPQLGNGAADMSYIVDVAREIGPVVEPGAVVVNKSTVPVGSTRVVEQALGRDDVAVVSNPEFLREGMALHDCLHPDRIVIGAEDQAAAIRVAALYSGVKAPVMVTDPASAETIKYASNAFLATKVSFVNAVANLCEAVGADVADVMLGMGYDRRIGSEFLRPGPGWGGSCLPKDTRALVRIGEDAGYDFSLLRGVIAVNEEQHARVVAKVAYLAGGSLDGATVAVWGLTFKARTDDRRDSPAVEIVRRLGAAGAVVRAYDPTVAAGRPGPDRPLPVDLADLPGVEICADAYAAAEGASVVAVLTEWDELRWLDFAKVAAAMATPCMVDARNLMEPAAVRRAGFSYQGLGRL
ncbi:MAG: UDP-glucose dehydrogenase family protein, partial [Acidimicrobiales bacterium]